MSRLCAVEEPFPRRPGETYDRVSSCAECPPYPLADVESIKEEIKKVIVETIREEHHHH